jgi:antitoxin HicB
MTQYSYPAKFARDSEGFLQVRFRDLPEAITFGADKHDAIGQAADCLEEAIAGRIAGRQELPQPSPLRRGETPIPLPANMAAKAALYLAMRQAGMKKSVLAKLLGVDEKEVRRMLDPRQPTELPRVQEALRVFSKTLVVSVDEAA